MHAFIHLLNAYILSAIRKQQQFCFSFISEKNKKKIPFIAFSLLTGSNKKKIIHFNLSVIRKQQRLDLEASLPEVFGRLGVLFLRITAPSAAASAVQAPTTTKTTTSSSSTITTTAAGLSSGAQTPGTHSQKLREREGGGDHGRERGREEERKRGREEERKRGREEERSLAHILKSTLLAMTIACCTLKILGH